MTIPNPAPARPETWRSFFRLEEFQRHKFSRLVPRHPTTDIMHGDLECRFTFPVPDGRTASFLNLPWLRANRQTEAAPYKVLTTDLREEEAVLGGVKAAARALRLAAREAGEGIVLLNSGCVPDLIGEDLSPLARRFERSGSVFYHRSDGKDMAPIVVREMLGLSRRLKAPRRVLRSAALIGYPGGLAGGELVSLLEESGVRAASCLVPDISPAALARARGARLLVLAEDRLLEGVSREIVSSLAAPCLRPPPPYGLKGTRSWLEAVCAAAGARASGRQRAWARRLEPVRRRWARLSVQARACRLGFVLDPAEAPLLSDPSRTGGVPLVSALKEMGFRIELLIHSPGGRPRPAERAGARYFTTESELGALLESSSCGAFYSDCFFDHRLTRRGKAQFSLASFEPGLEGSLRTLQRLVAACRLPFYRRYRGYL